MKPWIIYSNRTGRPLYLTYSKIDAVIYFMTLNLNPRYWRLEQ